MLKKIKGFLFTNQTIRQTVTKNTFWLAVSNIGGRLLKAVIIVYAARILGVTKWGVFSYAVTLTAFITVFIDFGINSILIRESSKTDDPRERSKILSTSFVIKTAFLALGAFIIIFIAPHFTNIEGVKQILLIVTFILIFDSLREFGFSLIKMKEKMEIEAGLFMFTNLAIVVFGFFFLKIHPSTKSFAFSYAAGTGLGMLVTAFVLRDKLRRLFSDFTLKLVKPILSVAWPFAISGVLGILMINTDILIIGALLKAEDVGLYSAADRIMQILYMIPAVISASILPTLSRLAYRDNKKIRQILENVIGMILLAAIPISIGGFILGKEIITFIFGSGYIQGALSFQILILTLMINFPAVILSGAIFAYNSQKSLIMNAAIGGILNVVLDLILIPKFGIVGSAAATFIAISISNVYLWLRMKKINYFEVGSRLGKIIIATMIMGIGNFIFQRLGMHVLANVIVSIFVYMGTLMLLKEPLLRGLLKTFGIKKGNVV